MAKISETKESLRKLCSELEVAQSKMDSGELTEAEGKDFAAKAKEALSLQAQVDEYNRISGIVAKGREIPSQALPGAKRESDENPRETAGYATLGEQVVRSEAYQQFIAAGAPRSHVKMFSAREIGRASCRERVLFEV